MTVFPRSRCPNKNHTEKSRDGGRTRFGERAVKSRPARSKRRTYLLGRCLKQKIRILSYDKMLID